LIIEVLNKVTGGKSGSDKLRTYVPEIRQYWSGTSLFSSKYHGGTLNSCYLRTYILLVPYDLHMSKVFKTVIKSVYICVSLSCLCMKLNWTDRTNECWSRL
jgi:hypothetical protein